MQFRQGDVFIESIDENEVPDDLEPVETEIDSVILAQGEATGHAHRITDHQKVKQKSETGLRVDQGETEETYLELQKPADLIHEEHDDIGIPPGNYRVLIQREYGMGPNLYGGE